MLAAPVVAEPRIDSDGHAGEASFLGALPVSLNAAPARLSAEPAIPPSLRQTLDTLMSAPPRRISSGPPASG
ncbi:hypothetical protein [Halomonas sp. E19]|uniref:hypothetical protein n=1 Tax=Halomonas sp. E19 TaxID=3397247 RepID=UPI004033D86C